VLGWQVYSMRQSTSGELAQLRQALAEKDTELAQLRKTSEEKDAQLSEMGRQRSWRIRAAQSIVIGELVLTIAPQVNGTMLAMGTALRPGLLGHLGSVRVLTTAPNWGADDKVLAASDGVIRVQYQFPLAVTEATIALAPRQ